MRGIIDINILDAKTLEVLHTTQTKNIVTPYYITEQLQYKNLFRQLNIVITSAPYKSTLMWPKRETAGDSLGSVVTNKGQYYKVMDRQIGSTPYLSFINNTETEPFILEYAGRFDSPAVGTSRTIQTVILGLDGLAYAFSELAAPCTQTDQQIMDIRYRIIFDYDESINIGNTQQPMSRNRYYDFIKSFGAYPSDEHRNYRESEFSRRIVNAFPKLKIKPSDTGQIEEGFSVSFNGGSALFGSITSTVDDYSKVYGASMSTVALPTELESMVGSIIGTISVYKSAPINPTVPTKRVPLYTSQVFNNGSKIQNVIGYSTDSTNASLSNFMSPDTLPLGTGRVNITGPWQDAPLENDPATIASGLYYKTHLPRRDIITIVDPGPVGQATYRYSKQGFVKSIDIGSERNLQTYETIPNLTSFETINADKSLIGRLTSDNFTLEQLSATISYDGSSVLIPRKARVLLYSIAESNYWFITGTFTNIHQLDVKGDWIFIACKDTGLYKVNPKISLVAEKVSTGTAQGAVWTLCKGVAVTNTKIWAMASNMLVGMTMDGSGALTFTDGIDHTSTAPFILPGDTASSQTIEKITYIKADKESTDYKIFCVFDHAAVPANTGFFLSSAGIVVFTGYTSSSSYSQLKFNKSSIGFVNGRLCYFSDYYFKHRAFGATTESQMSGYSCDSFHSIITSKNLNDDYEGVILHSHYSPSFKTQFVVFNPKTLTVPMQMARDSSLNSLRLFSPSGDDGLLRLLYTAPQPPLSVGNTTANITNVMLDNGVVFGIGMCRDSKGNNVCHSYIFLTGLDRTPHGGSGRWISRKDYGWDGSNWVEGHSGVRTTSTSPQALTEGLSVSFENGANGTSFVANESYKFGLCRGLMKDNITKFAYTAPVYTSKTHTRKATLGTIAVVSGQTGTITLHPNHRSKDSFINAQGEIVFPGCNIGQYATAVQRLVGNFEISFPLTNKDSATINDNSIIFGIGFRRFNKPMAAFKIYNSTSVRFMRMSNRTIGDLASGGSDIDSLLTTDIVSLQKSGSTFTLKKNSVTVSTHTLSNILAAEVVLDIVANTNYSLNSVLPDRAAPPITIVSNGSATYLDFPSQFVDDANCYRVSEYSPVVGYLDGVAVPTKIDGTLPAPGEISIAMDGLYAVFNEADIGKVAEVECTLVYHT